MIWLNFETRSPGCGKGRPINSKLSEGSINTKVMNFILDKRVGEVFCLSTSQKKSTHTHKTHVAEVTLWLPRLISVLIVLAPVTY